ncbi:uncharacterized protein LOC114552954 [Perca flavescens]|uniref:uncharacterized protein LOC114552954 n=1 Tax=Perca flavescens TaxID=8167 RepID=UPI00106ECDD4|nr:uncharacterized protein LOC114552954 [Perca flavescens]
MIVMAASAAVRDGRAGSLRRKTESYVYKTTDGKVIIENELLNFIVIKMRTLVHDEIVLLVTNNFSSEWIEESKRLLFEKCPTSMRCVKHKGSQKDINNIKDCLKVLNECGENIPRFVSHNLDELPPVGFEHVDASALLSRVQQLSREVAGLRATLETQTRENENAKVAAAAVEHRLSALERRLVPLGQAYGDAGQQAYEAAPVLLTETEAEMAPARLELRETGREGETMNAIPRSPEWSTVVKKGKYKQPSIVTQSNAAVQPRPRREQRKKMGILGTGTESNIPVIKTKLEPSADVKLATWAGKKGKKAEEEEQPAAPPAGGATVKEEEW